MSYPASAGAAETANGAVERMVLLGLTARIISKMGGARLSGEAGFGLVAGDFVAFRA